MPPTNKFLETESKFMLPYIGEKGEWGVTVKKLKGIEFLFLGCQNVLELR